MQRKFLFSCWAGALFFAAALNASAQGTAISYQGRLFDAGAPANTNYDLRFSVYDAVTNGNRISIYVTNTAVPVSNGLFSVTLDFGDGVFNGTSNGSNDWLDVAVRASGGTTLTALTPRQPILPVPYALFATSASNLLGRLPSSVFSGTYSNTVNFNNGTNTFTGTFSGNGASLTNLNATNITSGTLADGRLSANVALLNATQVFTGANTFTNTTGFTGPATFANTTAFSGSNTFTGPVNSTGANTFSGINTFTNNGNYFQGSFFGNGLVGWIAVSAATTNAMRDAGYLMQNAALSSVTLPTSPLSVGDIVRVSGGGGGGWLVKQNASQSIIGTFASYTNCQLTMAASGDYSDVAASADGVLMYAVGNSINGIVGVMSSTDGGRNWNSAGNLAGSWNSVACSANGKIVYAQPTSGNIQTSTNGGLTWTSTGTAATGSAIACTANGVLITGNQACSGNGTNRARLSSGVIQISNNNGGSWANVATAPASGITCLACSSDCTRLVAGVNGGRLFATSNQGASWTTLTSTNQAWSGAWMSPDGGKFAVTVSQSGSIGGSLVSSAVSALPNTSTTAGTSGSLCGSQGSAVELQYIGGNQFIPVGSSGLIWAN